MTNYVRMAFDDPKITGHRTPSGKVAVTAKSGDVSTTKYVVGGYFYYVLDAYVSDIRWDAKAREMLREPSVVLSVRKRTNNRDVALRTARKDGGIAYRLTDGVLVPVGAAV